MCVCVCVCVYVCVRVCTFTFDHNRSGTFTAINYNCDYRMNVLSLPVHSNNLQCTGREGELPTWGS